MTWFNQPQLFYSLFLVLMFCSTIAFASEIVVLYVDPPENEIAAGVTYETGEFIFVPAGTTAVLMDEDPNRYIIKGMDAVSADQKSLTPFRLVCPH